MLIFYLHPNGFFHLNIDFLAVDLRGLFVGTFPVLDSEKEAYPILGVNGLFGNGENLIRLISSYPFLQYVWTGPKSDKVEFQHRLNSTHGSAVAVMLPTEMSIASTTLYVSF